MRIFRIFILVAFFAFGLFFGCSLFTHDIDDVDLTPYKNKFAEDMGLERKDLDDISITFKTLKEIKTSHPTKRAIGVCRYATNKIEIDPRFWYLESNNLEKLMLIYHELGHCYCRIGHIDGIMPDKCPANIMHPSIMTKECARRHLKMYTDQLFEDCL